MKLFENVRIVLTFAATTIIAGVFGAQPIYSQHITPKEKRTVKVAYFYGEGFQEVSPDDGHRFGYGYDYLQNVGYFAGWTFEYIDTNWAGALKMLENGEVDILNEVSKTPEREKKFLFADRPQGKEEYYIFVNQNTIDIGNLMSLNGKKVGINAGSYQLDVYRQWAKKNNIHSTIIEYEDEDKRNSDFLEGKLDAAVDFDFYLDQGWFPIAKIGSSDYYIAVAKNRKDILEELNNAQSKLFESSPLFIERLQSLYFSHIVISKKLNVRENNWLKEHTDKQGKITIGYTDNYLPYCTQNKETGELEGALTEFTNKLKEVFGIEVETIAYQDRNVLYEAVRKNEICACFPIYTRLWQSEQLGIMQTEPIIDFPQAFLFRKDEYYNDENLKSVAVSKTSQLHSDYIHDKHPKAEFTMYKDYEDGIKAVSDGEVDGMFVNTFILARLYDSYQKYKNLDAFYLPNDASLSIGIAPGNPELLSIFNKTSVLLDKAVLTSALVHNSKMNEQYLFLRFFQDNLALILLFILLLSVVLIVFMKQQLAKTSAAMKQAEEAKLTAEESNLELEAALKREKESQTAVQEAFNAANKANAAKTEFLASMSHDIRTPMNAIIGMTALATANMDDKEKIQHCLSEITISSKHLLGLINEVLDMNKIESGKITLNESEFNMASLIDEFVAVAKPLVKEKHHELIMNVNGIKHENVIGDAGRIQQCLVNFMSNAVKYTPEGGTISISISEKDIRSPKIACYEFIFEDNGIGMSEDFVKVMFEPFSRADDIRAQNQQGTGLGMPITRNIIRMMNGDIKVESKLNKGTKITATIFIGFQDSEEDFNLGELSDLPVLVADDDKTACETTCFILNELGMKSEWVLSGKEAVELVTKHHENENDFFAVIIDWKMPEMDGIATTRAIREKVGPDVPIIIISAYDWTDIENEARKAGVNGFIAKPVFKSKVAHTFLALTGKEITDETQGALQKYKDEDFSGVKILLVEDNKVNAEIAKEILELTGLSVDIAWNGKEAVEKLESCEDGLYDMVFMDIQMPVMDGYQATIEIRKSERKYLRTVPIVAMSANAFAEDVQKSMAVGMNEHVAKPLDFKHLLSVVGKWTKRQTDKN